MTLPDKFEIFLATAPGLEAALEAEARERRFQKVKRQAGGVVFTGRWNEVWRANLELRCATRVLARLDSFRVVHLNELEKRARQFPWGAVLRSDRPFRVEAACRASRIYHSGAAEERIARGISAVLGPTPDEGVPIEIMARLESDVCTLSVDTSGELLHKRGFKPAVAKAPMRETMAASLLRMCGYSGAEPVLDPMCGSGTFVIEAAEIASGLFPGRERDFAFQQLATFDAQTWAELKSKTPQVTPEVRFFGSDRDAGAVASATANAARAGVDAIAEFQKLTVSEIVRPGGPPGLVMVNPPYGDRVGDKKKLAALYKALGATLLSRFSGWRVGLVTTEAWLAAETGLPFEPPSAPIAHGGLRVKLFQTKALP